jgi:proteasome activator subunit 4
MLQYKFRTFHIHTRLNELDVRIIEILFRMATDSNYAIVRKDSQSQLFSLLAHYPYSSLLLGPKIVEILDKSRVSDSKEPASDEVKVEHDQLKGCLYLLSGNSVNESLMVKQNWRILNAVWPALFRCQQFEKPTIQTLLDRIYFKANKDFDSFDNRVKLADAVLLQAFELTPELRGKYVTEGERLKKFNEKCQIESALISNLMNELIKISKESQLLWKNQSTSLGTISLLFNTCRVQKSILTEDCLKLLVDSLVSENIHVRKVSLDALCIVLKMIKHKKQTKRYNTLELINQEMPNGKKLSKHQVAINEAQPGYRLDNSWHVFDPDFLNNQQKWDNTCFLDKSFWGYYCWPSSVNVNVNKRETYPLEDVNSTDTFSQCVKPIRDRFMNDSEFVLKFIRLSTIEESKGKEKFDKKHFYLFKALFRNFGSAKIFNNLFVHLNKLITDKESQTHECSQKLASELVSGLIRGSKYWSFSDLKELWAALKPLLDLAMDNMTTETLKLWFTCFSNAFEDQDPRRLTFYMNYFSELFKKMLARREENDFVIVNTDPSNPTSFQQASCLNLIAGLSQLEWRAQKFWSNLVDVFQANMTHPYKSIREKIGA